MPNKVELICLSKPSAITECNTAQELIAYCARISNPANQTNMETAPKLIRYLMKNAHWSPFEMVHMSVKITTTRDIARQILRHRSFSFQEFSQRYAVQTNFELREARLQDPKNRQNSVEVDDRKLQEDWHLVQARVQRASQDAYTWALEKGIAKEQARAVLPEGMTESTMIMSGTLRSFIHYCQLRMKNGTQKEHRDVAESIWDIIGVHFPDIVEAVALMDRLDERKSILDRIDNYLQNGGLFNPELMEHDKVRELLRDAEKYLRTI